MTRDRITTAAIVAVLVAFLGWAYFGAAALRSEVSDAPMTTRCTEDAICWNPVLDGNGRGSVALP